MPCLDRVKNCIKEVENVSMDCCFGGSRFSDDFCRDSNAGVWVCLAFWYNLLFGSLALTFKIYGLILFLIMLVAVVVVFFAMVFLAKAKWTVQ